MNLPGFTRSNACSSCKDTQSSISFEGWDCASQQRCPKPPKYGRGGHVGHAQSSGGPAEVAPGRVFKTAPTFWEGTLSSPAPVPARAASRLRCSLGQCVHRPRAVCFVVEASL